MLPTGPLSPRGTAGVIAGGGGGRETKRVKCFLACAESFALRDAERIFDALTGAKCDPIYYKQLGLKIVARRAILGTNASFKFLGYICRRI
jgi:hypothetical protein